MRYLVVLVILLLMPVGMLPWHFRLVYWRFELPDLGELRTLCQSQLEQQNPWRPQPVVRPTPVKKKTRNALPGKRPHSGRRQGEV